MRAVPTALQNSARRPGFHRDAPRKSHARFPGAARRSGRWTSKAPRQTRSEEHTSELQSLMRISYAVFCLKKKKQHKQHETDTVTNTEQHHHPHTLYNHTAHRNNL